MPTISLSMIVKNEEKHLARCLSSVKGVVDEIVIIDTGSIDKTLEIAESFDAKIFHFNWVNDFSAARNFALSKCSCAWILYLDADEELYKNSIEELLNKINENRKAINCIVKSLTGEKSKFGIMKYPRLFPNDARIKFEGKVHEQIQNSLDKNKINLIDSSIEIIHYGYILDEESANKKLERNLELLLPHDKKKTNHYDTLRLAQTLQLLKRFQESEIHFKKLINDKSVNSKLRGLGLLHYAILKYETNDIAVALDNSLKAYKYIPKNAYLNYFISLIYLRSGDIKKSYQYLLVAVERNQNLIDKTASSDNEIVSDQTDLYFRAVNLAIQLNDEKNLEKLLHCFSSYVSSEKEVDQTRVFNTLKGLITGKELANDELDLLISFVETSNLQTFLDYLQRNYLSELKENILLRLNNSFFDSAIIKKNLALFYLDKNQNKAIELFNESLKINDDPSIYFYLISLYLAKREYEKIRECFYTLSKNHTNHPELKTKIQILSEKLNSIINSPIVLQRD
jgi:glycosyltransferase involved in cell wall biosynthesis